MEFRELLAGVKQRKREWELTSERLSEIRDVTLGHREQEPESRHRRSPTVTAGRI